MIKIIGILFILLQLGFANAETKQVSLKGYEPLIIYNAEQISDISQGENLFSIDRFEHEIHLTPKQPFGNSYVHVIYKDGRIDTIMVDITPIQSERRSSGKNGYLLNLRGRSNFFSSSNESNNQHFGNYSSLFGRLNFTENTYFATEYRYRKTMEGSVIEDSYTFYKFGYKNNYLYLGSITDTLVAPMYFNENLGRGGRLYLTDDKVFTFEYWTDENYKYSGQSLYFKNKQIKIQHSKGENEVWGFYNYLNLDNFIFITNGGLTTKSVDNLNRYSFSEDVLYNFRNSQENKYSLRNISVGFATAPQGSYSLNTAASFPMLTYQARSTISSQSVSGVDELNRDYIKGLFLTTLQYNGGEVGPNRNDNFSANNSFGSNVFTLGLDLLYSKQSGTIDSNTYQFSPYLQYFFSGDKDAGWSIRTQYQILQTDYLTTESSSSQSESSVFLVKNKGVFNMGIGGGSGTNTLESSTLTNTTEYKTLQSFINYYLSIDKQFSLNYAYNFYENSVKSQYLASSIKYIPLAGYFLYGSAKYNETQNQVRTLSNFYIGLGFGFDLYIGEKDIYSSYNQDRTYLTVSFYNDLNNNQIQDINEESLSDVDFIFNGEKETLSGTTFTKKVLPELQNFISLDDKDFSSISEKSISIVGNKSIAIPVYKIKTVKYKIMAGSNEMSGKISSSCDESQYKIDQDSKKITYNTSKECLFYPEVADYNLIDTQDINGDLVFLLEKQKFIVYLTHSGKKKSILYKGKPINFTNNEAKIELNSFNDYNHLDFNLKECYANPGLQSVPSSAKIINISINCP